MGRIFGQHVADYMRQLQEEGEGRFEKQFKQYIDAGIGPDDLEELYEKVHQGIRDDPNKKRTDAERGHSKTRDGPKPAKYEKKRFNQKKISLQQRKNRVKQVFRAMHPAGADAGAEMEED